MTIQMNQLSAHSMPIAGWENAYDSIFVKHHYAGITPLINIINKYAGILHFIDEIDSNELLTISAVLTERTEIKQHIAKLINVTNNELEQRINLLANKARIAQLTARQEPTISLELEKLTSKSVSITNFQEFFKFEDQSILNNKQEGNKQQDIFDEDLFNLSSTSKSNE